MCFLGSCRPLIGGAQGVISASGNAFGSLFIPNLPVLVGSGLTLHAAFVTMQLPNMNFLASSAPSQPIVIN